MGPKTVEFVENKIIQLLPYMLKLDYNAWDYSDIASAVLPEDLVDGPFSRSWPCFWR